MAALTRIWRLGKAVGPTAAAPDVAYQELQFLRDKRYGFHGEIMMVVVIAFFAAFILLAAAFPYIRRLRRGGGGDYSQDPSGGGAFSHTPEASAAAGTSKASEPEEK